MPTTQAEFKAVASELKVEFSDFFKPVVFSLAGSYSPSTGNSLATTETVDVMREEYKQSQIDGQTIQSNDFMLLALVSDFNVIEPKTGGLKVSVDGLDCSVVKASKDAANAVWTIQVRQ